MRIVERAPDRLVLRVRHHGTRYFMGRYLAALIVVSLAASIAVGLVLARWRTLECTRDASGEGTCEIREGGALGASNERIALADVRGARAERSWNRCRAVLDTSRGSRQLSIGWTRLCTDTNADAARVDAYVHDRTPRALSIRFHELGELAVYLLCLLGGALVMTAMLVVPDSLTLTIDRKAGTATWVEKEFPWRAKRRVFPTSDVSELVIEKSTSDPGPRGYWIRLRAVHAANCAVFAWAPFDADAAAAASDAVLDLLPRVS